MNILSRLLLVGTLCLSSYVSADDEEWKYGWPGKPDSDSTDGNETIKALAILFAASNVVIPDSSSCTSLYDPGRPKIKDFLAMRMTGLFKGQVLIEGKCEAGFCLVGVWEDATMYGFENLSSTQIKFGVKNGKLNPEKLACHFSP
jgi:hypothetical protein